MQIQGIYGASQFKGVHFLACLGSTERIKILNSTSYVAPVWGSHRPSGIRKKTKYVLTTF